MAKAVLKEVVTTPLDRLRYLVEEDLTKVDEALFKLIVSKIKLIPDISEHTFTAGGKRLRPMLTLASAKMCGYKGKGHIGLAASVECIHTATLLHDDVVDKSILRRGLKTANILWGNKESILVGDYLFAKAFYLMKEAKSLEVYNILSNASVVISEGEVQQLSLQGTLCNEQVYIDMISAKTAELFASACEVGAVLAKCSTEKQQAFKSYGLNLGRAYQIIDDVLDYSALQEKLGKSIGDDFMESKATLPVIIANQKANSEESAFWKKVFVERSQTRDDLPVALSIIEKHDALSLCMEKAKGYVDEARKALEVFEESEYREVLAEILGFVLEREY